MIPLFLTFTIPFTSPQFCIELQHELNGAAQRQIITQEHAGDIHKRCLEVYTKGQYQSTNYLPVLSPQNSLPQGYTGIRARLV